MYRQNETPTQRPKGRRTCAALVSTGLVAMLVAGGCGADGGSRISSSRSSRPAGGTTLDTAPDSERIDTAVPSFSNPTEVTNPLFPISEVSQVVHLGEEGGDPLRAEVTLLPTIKTIEWSGQQVDTTVSQYVAYLDGRILEVALDYYAQADDGSVWYFGEDVFNYEDGVVADHEGTWLAGRDGPPGMIMPAEPKVGDVYRPENVPGLVFEEVTVKSTDETVAGPRGSVDGAVLVEEHLMEGTVEDKAFAPAYGEFRARTADELLTVAVAVPVDSVPAPAPSALASISAGAAAIFDAAYSGDREAVSATLDTMTAAWDAYRDENVPELLDTQMGDALDALAGAVHDRDGARTRRASIDTGRASLDLELRHRPPDGVDVARLDLWARQILVDAAAEDAGAVAGDVAAVETIWNRVRPGIDATGAERFDAQLRELRAAADSQDVTAVTAAVPGLREMLAGLPSGSSAR